jgi:replicative DNA helicase
MTEAAPSGSTNSFKIPPHSIEAEESVLGGILLDADAINICLERLTANDFYRAAHRAIFEAMVHLTDRREPIDIVTLSSELRSMGLLEQSGGLDNLSRLASVVPSAANIGFYARTVKEMAVRRRVIHESSKAIENAFETQGDFNEFLDSTEQNILKVSDERTNQSFFRVNEIVQTSIQTIEKLYDNQESVTGIPTGYQ